jgi:hypothetical protein
MIILPTNLENEDGGVMYSYDSDQSDKTATLARFKEEVACLAGHFQALTYDRGILMRAKPVSGEHLCEFMLSAE